MNLPRMFIRRHVFAWMVNAVLVLFGIIGYQQLGVDRFPRIEFPVISITTVLPGANPEIVDSSITNVIETSVNSTPGIDILNSSSSPGVSNVAVQFDLSKDADVAFNEVQAKVNQVLNLLPEDAEPPVVAKVEIGASPIMWIALQGDRTLQQLNQYARNVIKKRLETIDGVGEVRLGGRRDRTIRVELDPAKMAAYEVSPSDIRETFAGEHLQLPGGFLVDQDTENLIELDMEFHSPAALERMIVRYADGAPVRISDIGRVVDGLADYRQVARFNGTPSVGIGIVKIANANTVAIVDAVKARLESEIVPQLPPGMEITVASDDSELIEEIVAALEEHLLQGTLLAALVVLVFLRSVRSTLIVATAIPVSLMGAVAAMFFFGYTFNTLTLLGLLLLIGVVVDDAIVVLENIYRHREEKGEDMMTSSVKGTDQVVFAVLAASLTLVSIFGSVIFLGGMIGRFFESFAVVVTVGVLVSLFVSLSLTPMLCSRFLVVKRRHGRVYETLDRLFAGLDSGYRAALGWAIGNRLKVVAATVAVVISSGWFFGATGKAFVPEEDEARFVVSFRAPLGTSIERTDEYLKEVESVLASHEEIRTYFTAIGLGQQGQVNSGIAFVRMVPREQRDMHQSVFMDTIRAELGRIAGVQAFASLPSIVAGQRGEPLQFAVTGPDLEQVAELSERLHARLAEEQGIGRLDLNVQLDLPQLEVNVDRTRAADLGLTAADVASAINMLAGGVDVARYNDEPGDGERYDVRVKAQDGTLETPDDLSRIFLRADNGAMVRVDTVAQVKETIGPAVINRLDLQYAANFFGTPSIPLGEAVSIIEGHAAEILPLGYQVKMLGQAREFEQTAGYMAFAFSLAIILVYMVLASQFDSFVQPVIVMVAQPLAIIGGVFALWVTGNTLNIYSMIGLVLLIGLVAKNSILLVDLANQYRDRGMAVDVALSEACPVRLRPVLMTSFTVILALSPAALGLGAGSDTNGPLAIAVIGGMISSTLLTLVVVPAVYSLIENRLARRRAAAAGGTA